MKVPNLTNRASASHKVPVRTASRVSMAILGSAMAAGCISVKAPDKPIVIELNINIKQEVIYRLAPGAQNTIEQNSSIF